MAKNNSLCHHKVTLLPIQHQILLLASLEHFLQIIKAVIKIVPKSREVIHEDVHKILDHIAKDAQHAPLKGSRHVTKFEWHPAIGESAKWTGKSGLFLIFWINFYLVVTTIPVKKAIELMSHCSFKELVYEW